uniref:Proteasome subunit beta n=1 Tax=Astyanax mexicanus TaxID=7994 RepID=A0A8B9L928_ASTMX
MSHFNDENHKRTLVHSKKYKYRFVLKRTTILAVKFNGGVIIGSDSRASIGGSYVSNKMINKLIQVHDKIFCCIAGSLADAQAVTKMAKFQLSFHSIQMEAPPLVKAAASVLKELCYNNREELQAGFITADAKFKPDMSREECLQFTTNALTLAIGRDNVSGGVVHMVVITEDGVEHVVVPGDKLPKFHDE